MNPIVCRQLDLPKIPEELLNWSDLPLKFFHIVPSTFKFNEHITKEHYYQGQKVLACRCLYVNILWQSLQDWFSETVFGSKKDLTIWYTTIKNNHKNTNGRMFMHIDTRRSAALQYVIDTGGDNVRTNFYQERGGPLFQETLTDLEYDDVDLIDSVHMKKNCWYLFRTDVLHDVTELENTRRHISINLLDLDYWTKQTS